MEFEIREKIVKISERSRKLIEDIQIEYPVIFTKELGGLCGIAAVTITHSLKEVGIEAMTVVGEYEANDHCWTQVGSLIIDITATQFDRKEKIWLVEEKTPGRESYEPLWFIPPHHDRLRCQVFKEWWGVQKPRKTLIKKLVRQVVNTQL